MKCASCSCAKHQTGSDILHTILFEGLFSYFNKMRHRCNSYKITLTVGIKMNLLIELPIADIEIYNLAGNAYFIHDCTCL